MSSLSVKLPLARDSGDGFEMIKSFKSNQNALSIKIAYSIPNLNTADLLEFTI